jgi:hypothetical protein
MQAAASFREVVRRGQESQQSLEAARALLNLGDVLMTLDPVAAAEASRSARVLCRRIGARYLLGTVVANLIQSLLLTGDWDEARQVHASALTEDDLADDMPTVWGSVMMLAFSGEREQLAAAARAFDVDTQDPPGARGRGDRASGSGRPRPRLVGSPAPREGVAGVRRRVGDARRHRALVLAYRRRRGL